MKRNRNLVFLLILISFIILTPISAKASEENAIRGQINKLYKALKSHNYAKVSKIVKDKDSYFKFKKYDKIIGKFFLKELSKSLEYEINYINVYGDTADVSITFNYLDASNYYYIVRRELFASNKNINKNFAKALKKIRKKYLKSIKNSKDYVYMINSAYNTNTYEMRKVNGKWIIYGEDSTGIFNIYTCGYGIFVVVGGEDMGNYIQYEMNKMF